MHRVDPTRPRADHNQDKLSRTMLMRCCWALLLLLPSPASATPTKQLDPNRLEWGAIGGPAVNVDTGIEIAGVVHLARFGVGAVPYLWRLRMTFRFSMRPTPAGIEFPVHDYNARIDLPSLVGGRLRLQVRAGFQTIIAQYYGLGNAADGTRHWLQHDPETARDAYVAALRRYQYRRTSPYAGADLRWRLAPRWQLFGGMLFQFTGLERFRASQLEADHRQSRVAGSPQAQLLYGTSDHALLRLQLGLLWDERDNEFAPTKGWLHEASIRASPGAVLGLRHGYGGANVTLRFYITLWPKRLVLALRGVADVLWGHVPFYRMTATGGLFGTDSFGGGDSIRGVRAARFHGKAKLWGNLELRTRIVQFLIKKTFFAIGLTAFFDAGRTWLDYGRFAALDGAGHGLHFGTGGGLRVRWGKSLLIRFDLAWSPDANPIGFYFKLGHIF